MAIHDLTIRRLGANLTDRFWNEHNFVFEREWLFYYAKGATPGWAAYDRTIVPLTMADPILITRGRDAPNGLGFLPHGAGRNMSRTKYLASSATCRRPQAQTDASIPGRRTRPSSLAPTRARRASRRRW